MFVCQSVCMCLVCLFIPDKKNQTGPIVKLLQYRPRLNDTNYLEEEKKTLIVFVFLTVYLFVYLFTQKL